MSHAHGVAVIGATGGTAGGIDYMSLLTSLAAKAPVAAPMAESDPNLFQLEIARLHREADDAKSDARTATIVAAIAGVGVLAELAFLIFKRGK